VRRPQRAAAALLLGCAAAGLAACAVNPVSGRRQVMLITEEQEFAIGRGADREIRKEFGTYLERPSLRSYVDRVGTRLAAHGERPGLIFHFDVLDDPEINAFALPGGFVYITRGLLERLSSEDELAMVLGHEIAHVTARHGAARISALYALQYGSLAGVLISPRTFGHYGDLIDIALQVGLSAYSREQESQADELGITYAARAGFRPQAGLTVLKILAWLEGKEPGRLERWFRTHPPPGERLRELETSLAALASRDPSVTSRAAARDPYLREIDGLLVGRYNGSEMVLRDTYLNRELGAGLPIPRGWEAALDPDGGAALVALRKRGPGEESDEEHASLEAAPVSRDVDPAAIEAEFETSLRRRGWRRTGGHEAVTRQQVPARVALYEGATAANEPIGILRVSLVHGKHAWSVMVASRRATFDPMRAEYEAWGLSLRFLENADLASLGEPRLRVVGAAGGGAAPTWQSLAAAHLEDAGAAEGLAFYNGMDVADPPPELVKIPPSLALAAGAESRSR
jgi:predicted Zn-dependent protease